MTLTAGAQKKFVDRPITNREIDSLCGVSIRAVIGIRAEMACLKRAKNGDEITYWNGRLSNDQLAETVLVFRIDYITSVVNADMHGCRWLWDDSKRKFIRSDGKF